MQSNGSSAPSWIQATSANTASTIVKRDNNGNFSAGTITATLSGNASTATSSTYATYIKCPDTRSDVINPNSMTATTMGVRFDFKAKGTINLTTDAAYAGVMSYRPYASGSD